MSRVIFSLAIALSLLGAGCNKPKSPPSATVPQSTNQQVFQVKGVVMEVSPQKRSVTIKHEAVTNYMPAMTMPFDVKDTNELTGLAPGDPVSFRMTVTDTEGWIDHIQKTGPKTNVLPANSPFHIARDVERLNEGDALPEYHFIDQNGKAFSTKDFAGQALAINFLFTRCPYPTFCPLMANNFEAAQKKLLASADAPTNWHLLTISFDPDYDTPAVLKHYAASHDANPEHWTFATGQLVDIRAIAEQFGLTFWRDESGGLNHNLRTAIIDASGRVQKVFGGNEWKPDELISEIIQAAKTNRPPVKAGD